MNISNTIAKSRQTATVRLKAAFTLPEMLISMTIFGFLGIGILSATLMGMRWFQINQTKMLATSGALKTIGKMTDEIRGGTSILVGNLSTNGVFTSRTNGQTQLGTSLVIYPTTNTTNFILYFLNANDQTLRRTCTGSGLTTILAKAVTNSVVFQAQDFAGNVSTNNQNLRTIRFTMQFFQTAPNTAMPDSYTLDTAVTRRSL